MLSRQPKPSPFLSAEVADEMLDAILSADQTEVIETLADLAVGLRVSVQADKRTLKAADELLIEREINHLIGALFRRSEAYLYALELFERRHEIEGGTGPSELLRDLVARSVESRSNEPAKRRRKAQSTSLRRIVKDRGS